MSFFLLNLHINVTGFRLFSCDKKYLKSTSAAVKVLNYFLFYETDFSIIFKPPSHTAKTFQTELKKLEKLKKKNSIK